MRAWYGKRISDRISENQSDEADSIVFISEEELFNDINLNQDELEGVERLEAFFSLSSWLQTIFWTMKSDQRRLLHEVVD